MIKPSVNRLRTIRLLPKWSGVEPGDEIVSGAGCFKVIAVEEQDDALVVRPVRDESGRDHRWSLALLREHVQEGLMTIRRGGLLGRDKVPP